MIKVAVTGASGFIGQHVLNDLNNLSVEVVAPPINGCISADHSCNFSMSSAGKPSMVRMTFAGRG